MYNHGSYLSLRCWCSCSALRYSLAFRPVRAFLHREKHMARALSACLVLPSDGSPNRGGWLKPDADAYFARARSKDFGNARESASKGPQRSDCLAKSKVRMDHRMPGFSCDARLRIRNESIPAKDFFTEAAAGDDFVGVQAYLRTFIGKDGPVPVVDEVERTLTGWEYFPPALGIAVRHTWEVAQQTPIFVTENGLASTNDSRHIDYTFDALAGLHSAMEEGIDVLGYLHWSLLDNYEWGSFTPTFGLVGWDKNTFERLPKPSLEWLGEISKKGVVSHP